MIKVTYDKPSANSDCKVNSVRRLVHAFGSNTPYVDKALDAIQIRGEWMAGGLFTGYDYDVQSWLTIEA